LHFVFLEILRPSADLGLGLGLGLGDPRVTPGSRKDHPGVTQGRPKRQLGEVSLFATKIRNGGVGSSMIAIIAEIAKLKTKPFNQKGHEGTQSEADESESVISG
jgi:hypothetical protein